VDEPDNAQAEGSGYGPCIDPSVIVAQYNTWHNADPTRPVFLSFGQGVAEVLLFSPLVSFPHSPSLSFFSSLFFFIDFF
jgi:hypothetical protein